MTCVSHDHLVVRGAREHNLKDISIELPRDSLVVFTGLSGSGKSSLAFDTIFAEGQRRYVESLSAYARQFLGQMDKPDVDFIEGLSPAVSIDQKSTNRNPRSTVGTITEVYDYLRLLFARAGRPHCPVCGEPITRQSPQQIVDRLLELPERTRFQVLAPVVRARKGEYVDLFAELQSKGFARARVDGEVVALTDPPKLEKQVKHTIDVVVDRLVAKGRRRHLGQAPPHRLGRDRPRPGRRACSSSSSSTSRRGTPSGSAASPSGWPAPTTTPCRWTRSSRARSRSTAPSAPAPSAPASAPSSRSTPTSSSPTRTSPSPRAPSHRGRAAPGAADYFQRVMAALADDLAFSMDTPWRALPLRARQAVLHGKNHKVHVRYRNRFGRERSYSTGFEGAVPFVKRRHSETDSEWSRERYEGYMREVPCPVCQGARLKPESLAVLIGGRSIAEVSAPGHRGCRALLRGRRLHRP